jgi:hypothetical protein
MACCKYSNHSDSVVGLFIVICEWTAFNDEKIYKSQHGKYNQLKVYSRLYILTRYLKIHFNIILLAKYKSSKISRWNPSRFLFLHEFYMPYSSHVSWFSHLTISGSIHKMVDLCRIWGFHSGLWRTPSSGMWRRVDHVKWTDVSEEGIATGRHIPEDGILHGGYLFEHWDLMFQFLLRHGLMSASLLCR